ncbi:MAG: hypothetical protein AAFU73_23050 [Planctomycetota bacterium]
MIEVSAKVDIEPWQRAMNALVKDQLPFATAATLTKVAASAQAQVRRELPRRFELRNRRLLNGIKVKNAVKRDWPSQRAWVGTVDEEIARHEKGGTFRPARSQFHAIPTRVVRRKKGGRYAGAVTKKDSPRKILSLKSGYVAGNAIRLRKSSRRQTRGLTMFHLRRTIRIRPRLGFEETVRNVVARRIQRTFSAELSRALRGARPR